MSVLEILQEGKRRIAKGWCQHVYYIGDEEDPSHVCLYGAVHRHGRAYTEEEKQAKAEIDKVLQTLGPFDGNPHFEYNDAPGRTAEDIQRVLDMAIEAVVAKAKWQL